MQSFPNFIRYALLLVLLYLFFLIIKPFVGTIFIAVVFTIVAFPFYTYLTTKFKLNSVVSASITLFLTLLFIITPLLILVSLLVKESIMFLNNFDTNQFLIVLDQLNNISVLGYTLDIQTIKDNILSSLNGFARFMATEGGVILSSIFNSIGLFFLFLVLYFYLLKDGKFLLQQFKKLLPYTAAEQKVLFTSFKNISETVFLGNLAVAVTSGLFAFIGFYLFGFNSPLIWAILVAIFSLIPTVGTFLIYLLATVVVYFNFSLIYVLLFVLFYIFVELILKENFLKPRLLDDKIQSHPIFVLLALIGGVNTFGSMGLIYGPLILITLFSLTKFSIQTK